MRGESKVFIDPFGQQPCEVFDNTDWLKAYH